MDVFSATTQATPIPSDSMPLDVLSSGPGTSPSETIASSPFATHERKRSCTFCRQRKIKCDRKEPCGSCLRTALECVYPCGPGRAGKTPRRVMGAQMVNQLSRLEAVVRRLESQRETNVPLSPLKEQAISDVPEAGKDPEAVEKADDGSIDQQLGRLMIKDTRSYYVSNILWARLSNEIEELRDMLYEPASEDEDSLSTETNVAPLGFDAAIFGFRALSHSLQSLHPPLPQSVALLKIFNENVAPLVRVFHMPTTIRIYWDAVESLNSLDKNTEALLFAIYYSAVISMDSEQCNSLLGVTRAAALDKFRFAVEQAMARANLLNTQSIILLQASVLFLSALRNEDDSRTTWSLTSLIFHIAQAMGLHRDGADFGLSVFQTELRRRLWWSICLLDTRSSEYHGYEPIVRESVFDTRLPLNINDADLTPEMNEPPPERNEATEMTFTLIRCQAMQVGWKIGYVPPSMRIPGRPQDGLSLKDRETLVEDLKQRLQEKYLQYCDTSVPFLLMTLTVARLIIARMWLVVHYPRGQKDDTSGSLDTSMRDKLFLTSIEVLELSSQLFANKGTKKWTWHSKTHIQWHAVASVLAEIISRPPSPDCDRAWEYVNIVYDGWKMKENEKKGTLWRPIKRLMAKARYVREMQKTDHRSNNRHRPDTAVLPNYSTPQSEDQRWSTALPNLSSCASTPAHLNGGYSSTIGFQNVFGGQSAVSANSFPENLGLDGGHLQSVFEIDPLDPFMSLLSEDSRANMFGGIADHDDVPQDGAGADWFGGPQYMDGLYFG